MKKALVWLLLLWPSFAFGIEIYGFLDTNCHLSTGFIVSAKKGSIGLLNVEGNYQEIRLSNVSHILVYNSHHNPVSKIHLDDNLLSRLKTIYTEESNGPAFSGWPVRFMEDMVVFYDVEGKVTLVNIDKISKLENSTHLPGKVDVEDSNYGAFRLGTSLTACRSDDEEGNGSSLFPTRVLGDKIKISKFVQNYEKGFYKLERFQTRTRFYARPYLFDEKTKVGLPIVLMPNEEQDIPAYFPLFSMERGAAL